MSSGHTPDTPFATLAVAASSVARVAFWRRLTLKGNLALEEGHDIRARPYYEEALSEAEQMFADAVLGSDCDAARFAPTLYGISCNDIVELARRQGDEVTVGIYLYRVAARLISVAESAQASFELRSRCLLHLAVASRALYRYFEQHGMWQAAQVYSGRENAALFSVQEMEAAASRRASQAASGHLALFAGIPILACRVAPGLLTRYRLSAERMRAIRAELEARRGTV